MAGKVSFQNQQDEGGYQEHHRGVTQRQQIQAEESQQNHDGPKRSRDNGARRIELQVDQQSAHHQLQNREIGVGEAIKNLLAQGRFYANQLRAPSVHHDFGTIKAGDGAPIHGVQQAGVIG